ncbi:MAG: hypothetical protein QW393_03430 [Candidatus Micrarchaeaceae archaeon]
MFKPNNKKMLTVLIAVAMIFSAFAVLSLVAQPAYASASGTVTYNPTTLGVSPSTDLPIPTVAFVTGGTFSSGATIYFYLSTTDSSTGLVPTGGTGVYDAIGWTTLTASSPTSLDQAVTFFLGGNVFSSATLTGTTAPPIKPGTYYILASDLDPSSISTPSALTSYAFPSVATQFVVQTASLEIWNAIDNEPATGLNALLVGGTGIAYGTEFDPGASVTVTLSYPGGTVLVTTTASSSGSFEATFTLPQLAGTVGPTGTNLGSSGSLHYTAVAQETNAYSASYPQGGITADSSFDVGPTLVVSPADYNGAAGTTLTLTGTGFPGGASIAASTTVSPSTSIEITAYGSSSPVTQTYHSAVTVSSTGQFTVSVTTVSAITATGPYSVYVQMTDTSPYATSIDELFYPAVFVSVPNPQSPGFFFAPITISGDYYPTVSPLTAAVYDFPAGATVSMYIGSTLLGNVTTDSLGYAHSSVSAIPAIPAGRYVVTASDSSLGITVAPTSPSPLVGTSGSPLIITAFFQVTDPIGNSLKSTSSTSAPEYVPQNGTLTVSAFGLAPQTEYAPLDSVVGNIAEYGTNVKVMIGSVAPNGLGFIPASNGSLVFTYQPFYGTYVTTGTLDSITISTVTGYEGDYFNYYQIGAAITTLSTQIQTSGSPVTVTVTNLVPTGMSQYYPGTSGNYNLYIGTTEIVSTPSATSTFSGSTLSTGVTFDVPTISDGLYNISVVYNGQPVSNALPQEITADAMLVVSSPGSSVGSGSIKVVSTYSSGSFAGYVIVGYGLISTSSVDLVIYNSLGPQPGSVKTTAPDGAFFDTTDLSVSNPIFTESAAGTFGVVLTINPGTASATEFYATYSVMASLYLETTHARPAGYSPSGVFYDFIGDTVTLVNNKQAGLVAGAYYDLYFGPMYLETLLATSSTSFGKGVTFTVPTVPSGLYYLNLTFTGKTAVVASQPFYVLPSYQGTITLQSAQGIPIEYAFPGQIISFVWTPSNTNFYTPGSTVVPPLPPTGSQYTAGQVYVTVYLNGTAYETLPATVGTYQKTPAYLNGSFLAPNAATGSYWAVSFGWSQTIYENIEYGGTPYTQNTILDSYTGTSMAYLGLVQGSGALLINITTADIASIITSSINTAMKLPLSELNAAIVKLNGTVVEISTAFGNMTTTLKTINATVSSIQSGIVTIKSDLGSIQTSLASLNASLVAFNNNVVVINTTLGKVTTSLNAINATITSTASGVSSLQGSAVTIITALGTINGKVSSVSNGTATIQTSLGKLTTNVSAIKTQTSGFSTIEIFLIVIIVLVLITLVVAFLAVNAANRAARKASEEKKQ